MRARLQQIALRDIEKFQQESIKRFDEVIAKVYSIEDLGGTTDAKLENRICDLFDTVFDLHIHKVRDAVLTRIRHSPAISVLDKKPSGFSSVGQSRLYRILY